MINYKANIKFARCQNSKNSTYLKIEDIVTNDNYPTNNDILFIPLNPLSLNKLKNLKEFMDDKDFIILKPFNESEIMPYDIIVVDKLKENDFKEIYLYKLSLLFDTKINTVNQLTYYKFTILNNELADKGFFITDQNREEKYIEILEKEDESLIDKLEQYLLCRDEISRASAAYEAYNNIKNILNECATPEEMEQEYFKFIEEWNSKSGYIKIGD